MDLFVINSGSGGAGDDRWMFRHIFVSQLRLAIFLFTLSTGIWYLFFRSIVRAMLNGAVVATLPVWRYNHKGSTYRRLAERHGDR